MDKEKVWDSALAELELALSNPNYKTWFKDTLILEMDDKGVAIGVPSMFIQEWLKKKYYDQIFQILKKQIPTIKKIDFKVSSGRATDQKITSAKSPTISSHNTFVANTRKTTKTSYLNPKYTFEAFVVGQSNKLAHAAGLAISKKPGKSYNPLFLYGGVGLGKTHLMQAIGHEIQKKDPKNKVLYVSCEHFCNEFIQSIRSGKINDFKKTYRGTDALLIDDIQFLAGKEGTQEEFFHTFNYLHQLNKQIVLSSDRPPKAIATLEDRLKSRFEWGVIADIGVPDFETRKAILESKSLEKNLTLEPETIEYIALNIQTNIRELEGALNRLMAFAELNQKGVDFEAAKLALKELITPNIKSISSEKILESVCRYYNLKKEDLVNHRRSREVVVPRQVTMYLLRVEMNYSFPRIATFLGKKDHTTIMHGCDKIEKEAQNSPNLQSDLAKIKESLYSY
ncbi:chromosomal replication initiator protein DnaA [Patescibacteria group bacterium]